jgi:hypothetical protein
MTKKPYSRPMMTTVIATANVSLCTPTNPYDCEIITGNPCGLCGPSIQYCIDNCQGF